MSFESIYRYCNQINNKHENLFSISLESEQKHKAENKCNSLQSRCLFICLFIFDYKALLVCVKNRTCLRIAIPAYCFNIFGSVFGILFVYFLRSWYWEVKPSGKVRESFLRVYFDVWGHFLIWTKKKKFFFWKLHIGMVYFFLDNYLFIRPENLETSLKI